MPRALPLTLLLLLLTAATCPAMQAPCPTGACPQPPRTIEVEGAGEVSLPPTVGAVSLTVEAQAATAAEAFGRVAQATGKVLEALKKRLTAPDRLTTEAYDLYPVYDTDRGQHSRLVGYRGACRLNLEVAGPERLGELIDAAVGAGATGLSSIQFSNPGLPAATKEASALALKDAKALAERLATEAGVKVCRLLSVTAAPEAAPWPQRDYRVAMAAEAGAPPIEPGQLKVRATVRAVYEMAEPADK